MSNKQFLLPCPCCGHLVFRKSPGSFDFCPICVWEDDNVQLRYVDMAGGANRVSLLQAQKNYQNFGVSEMRRLGREGSVLPFEKDLAWRLINLEEDNVELWESPRELRASWPDDLRVLYYWRDNYWRKK